MENKNPLISVIMSVWNDSKNVRTAIDSILGQSYKNFEFLIIDDGSTDSTYEILEEYKMRDSRIKIFKNEKNKGLTKSLNLLISYSNGDMIARQDSDDISKKSRLETQLNCITKNRFDICTSRALVKNTNKKIPGLSYYLPNKIAIKIKNPFIHGTLLIKKSIFTELDNYDEEFYYAQDYKLFWDILKKDYKIKKIREPLYYLNTANNISTNKSKEQKYYADCVRNGLRPQK
tara:strand:+ start:10264 stop:10959 length:696 start_codon:yes stop_codon:yes gene_type:complete